MIGRRDEFPSQLPPEQYTPLFAAACAGDLAAVRRGLEADPSKISATEWGGATLLHDAVQQKHLSVAVYLLDAGADINAVSDGGVTPLHMAAMNGDIEMIRLLLRRGANIHAIDARGWTAADRAEKWERPEAAAFLRDRNL